MQNTLREFMGRIAIGNADFVYNTTYSEDSIYKGRNCNLKLKSSFTKVQQIIQEKIILLWLAIQYRHKKPVYELSRSQRNEAPFEAKAKRKTTMNNPNRKKQRK